MENQEQLTQAQAVNVLIQAARIAQSKGAFDLNDAELVSRAVKVFVPPTDPAVNAEQTATETAEATAETTATEEAAEPVLQKVTTEDEAGN